MSDFRAFADSKDLEKITAFLENGLYISNTMLVMELDLENFLFTKDAAESVEKEAECPKSTLRQQDFEIGCYDTWELDEYLSCHKKCFGELSIPEQIEEQLQNINSSIFALRIEGELISSVMTWDIDENIIATENVFTVRKFQGRGYGTAILSKVLADFAAEGKKKARLTVYGDDNAAVSLYLKMGYKITKVLQEFSYE
ncbi:MAG: GNAT family N-acetyltransferase [Lachnospiraceae bacterium]|nr:GNAT family N-acetyltransferase [Lachnospiraceae bacterium]